MTCSQPTKHALRNSIFLLVHLWRLSTNAAFVIHSTPTTDILLLQSKEWKEKNERFGPDTMSLDITSRKGVGWNDAPQQPTRRIKKGGLRMNFLSDLGNMLSGGNLIPQSSIAHESPFCDSLMDCEKDTQCFAIQERPISFTQEDFDVFKDDQRGAVLRVRGAMLHLPGKDKIRIIGDDGEVLVLDRKMLSTTPTYDIYYGKDSTAGPKKGNKMGWIEKERIALTDTFNVYMEGKGGFGPLRPPPSYKLSGDFIDRNFCMINDKNEVVAKVCKDGLFQFWDSMNHYQVQVASGMDPALVIACACAIDEEFDEEHQERKKREETE